LGNHILPPTLRAPSLGCWSGGLDWSLHSLYKKLVYTWYIPLNDISVLITTVSISSKGMISSSNFSNWVRPGFFDFISGHGQFPCVRIIILHHHSHLHHSIGLQQITETIWNSSQAAVLNSWGSLATPYQSVHTVESQSKHKPKWDNNTDLGS